VTELSGYPEAVGQLRSALREAGVDAGSLERRIGRCDLRDCLGTCCYDGTYLEADEAAGVRRTAREKAAFFASVGIVFDGDPVVPGRWDTPGVQTAVVPRAFSRLVRDYPAHFADTACVFLTAGGACSLQLLAEAEGRHRWWYKPTGCWLHPLTTHRSGRRRIALEHAGTDPFVTADYPGFVEATFCGRTRPGGAPARAVLAEELQYLGRSTGVAVPEPLAGAADGS
jgi:hypothetical protein